MSYIRIKRAHQRAGGEDPLAWCHCCTQRCSPPGPHFWEASQMGAVSCTTYQAGEDGSNAEVLCPNSSLVRRWAVSVDDDRRPATALGRCVLPWWPESAMSGTDLQHP